MRRYAVVAAEKSFVLVDLVTGQQLWGRAHSAYDHSFVSSYIDLSNERVIVYTRPEWDSTLIEFNIYSLVDGALNGSGQKVDDYGAFPQTFTDWDKGFANYTEGFTFSKAIEYQD